MSIRKRFILIITLVALLLVASGTLAQDDVVTLPTDTPVVIEAQNAQGDTFNVTLVTPEDVQPSAQDFSTDDLMSLDEFMQHIGTLFALFAVGAGVVAEPITSVIKLILMRFKPEWGRFIPIIAFVVPIVFTVVAWVFAAMGQTPLFEAGVRNGLILVNLILSGIAAITGQAVTYQVMKVIDAPGIGATSAQMDRRPKEYYGPQVSHSPMVELKN